MRRNNKNRFAGETRFPKVAAVPACIAGLVVLASCPPLHAHEGHSELIEELVVYGRGEQLVGIADAASEGIVGYADFRLPPLLRVGELAEAVPGMVATQHSGTGKANQYFLRGFNLDHGTDFAAFADGVPVNMRTHGHGQGYLDLNFLIPELVETATYRKGPYSVEAGDFSSAGMVSFKYRERLDESLLSVTAGSYGFLRGLAAGSFDLGNGALTAALDVTRYQGPWDLDEDLEQARVYVAHDGTFGSAKTKISFSGYRGKWNSTDQVPERLIDSGAISPLGYVDPDLGGDSSRYALNAMLDYGDFRALAYVVDYDLDLWSNFTYYLDDPTDGDEFKQVDRRQIYGVRLDGQRQFEAVALGSALRWGVDIRMDDIGEVGLFDTVDRAVTSTTRQDKVDESSLSAYGEFGMLLTDALRVSVGARFDYLDWDVDALRQENSGRGNDTILSPKVNLAYRFSGNLEAYLNWGNGFHSNDVRGTTISIDPATGDPAIPVSAFAESQGAELGLRVERGEKFNATMTAFALDLDSELVFVGDAGTTEPNDGTERRGVELTAFWQATPWLAANLAYTYTDARYKSDQGGDDKIPGAIPQTATIGLTGAWETGSYASLRIRYLGDAPLTEDNSVRSGDSLLVNAGIGHRWRHFEVRLDGFNLLDSRDADISYFYASRLPGEAAAGIEDIHLHPLEPRSVRASLTYHWN